jgi:hypothetical protein
LPDDTYPIDEVLKKLGLTGQRLKIFVSGVQGVLDGFLEDDLGAGYSRFRQPAMTLQNPMTGQDVDIPESTVNVYRPSIVLFEASETTAAAKLSQLIQ